MTRPPHPTTADRTRALPLGGAIPLEWKLPLLVTGFLATGLAVMLFLVSARVTQGAQTIVRARLSTAVQEIAASARVSIRERAAEMSAAAREPAVARALAPAAGQADLAAARRVLAGLAPSRDSTLPVELWDAQGRVVARIRRELPAAQRVPLAALPPGPGQPADAVRFGPFQPAGGSTVFWMVAPVPAEGRIAGYVAQPRGVGGPRDIARTLRQLLGEDVALFTRNADGSFWSAAPGQAGAAPQRRDSSAQGLVYHRPTGRTYAAEARVAGTPWVFVLETPERWVLARPRATTRRLAVLGLVITAVGGALSWVASRRITRPLAALTAASEAVAMGTYAQPVSRAGRDEIGRLAASFDAMARQVAGTRRELEYRVAEAQGAADELAEANQQLRVAMDQAERARADAERARGEAESASRAKGDFLAVMSHELRTPLNAIGGYAELLEMGIHGPVTDAQKLALARIGRSQAHLLALINDLLSYARIDAGQVQYALEDVPLHDALAELEEMVAPQVHASRLIFTHHVCDPDLKVRADRDKLRQVVLNLLANAIKYTPEGGSVEVACDADDHRVRVHVRDTGTGIRADRLPHIFEPFVQGERALNRPDEGVGLGLAISRDLARGMGGELEVASEPGAGSTFTLVLARAAAPAGVAIAGVPLVRAEPAATGH
ncbi:MAG TPA: HAMP domain-containing sensor histidine kinase [Longimicrobium sp.]|nr:HAMP domain-containing sensor histidine kinase [Longimicrobium sp.]